MEETAAVLNYHFNVNATREKLQYMYIRVTKEALSVEELMSVQKKCSFHYGVPLTLTMQVDFPTASTFENTIFLTSSHMKEKVSVNFTGFTQAFREVLKDKAVNTRVYFSLTVSGSCQHLLKPADLGFAKSQPWIVAFLKDFYRASTILMNLSELVQHVKSTHYNRRQAMDDPAHEEVESNIARSESPCRMYTQRVSKQVGISCTY